MKSKNNHPITDSLGGLSEEAVRACMSEDVTPRAVVSHGGLYRKLAVAAACLTLTLTVGAAVALPLMRAEEPALPETEHSDTAIEPPPETDAEAVEAYPFVRFQVLSYSENDTKEPSSDGDSSLTIIDELSSLRTYNLYLQFDCAEGETVTITSHDMGENDDISERWQETLSRVESADHRYGSTAEYVARILTREIYNRLRNKNHSLLKLDSATYMWCYPTQTPERNYDVVSFVIRNENGEITGAGSICIGIHSSLYHHQLRYEVLGSIRFDTPISEEAVNAYLASLEATAEETYANIDFSPQTEDEGFALAYSAVSALPNTDHVGCYSNGNCAFRWYTGYQIGSPYTEEITTARRFFLFTDGTYVEIAPESYELYDGMLEALGASSDEADFSDLAIPLTDGRVITFRQETFTEPADGETDSSVTRTKWVAVILDPLGETV